VEQFEGRGLEAAMGAVKRRLAEVGLLIKAGAVMTNLLSLLIWGLDGCGCGLAVFCRGGSSQSRLNLGHAHWVCTP